MSIFGKKKEKEVDDEEDILDAEEEKTKKFTKKLKDLNPENKRKRKEPPKPWGVKERMIVLVTFVLTVFVAAFLALTARNYSFGKIGRWNFKLPSVESFNVFKEETFILEKDTN